MTLIDEAAAGGTDLVVLPELSTTPYFAGTRDAQYYSWAEPVPGPSTDRFAEAARRNRTAIIVGMYERSSAGALYNSAVVIDRDGNLVPGVRPDGSTVPAYRKTFVPSVVTSDIDVDEKFYLSPGQGHVCSTSPESSSASSSATTVPSQSCGRPWSAKVRR